MNRNKFLKELNKLINTLPKEEKDDVINYYSEYFDDAGVDNENEVIKKLGTPKEVADKILEDYNNKSEKNLNNKSKNKIPTWLIIVIVILGIPIGIPIIIAILAIIFSILLSVFAFLLAFFISSMALFMSGIIIMIFSIVVMFNHFPTALMLFGISLIFLGISVLIYLGVYILTKKLIKYIIKLIKNRGKKNEK